MDKYSVVAALIWHGWRVGRCGWDSTVFEWRSPRGLSGSEWVSIDLYEIPAAVLRDAKLHNELSFDLIEDK